MKTESISLDQWRSNLASQQRFANFFANVSQIIFKPKPESGAVWAQEIGTALVEGSRRVHGNIIDQEG